MAKEKAMGIEELIPDEKNFNKGTEAGRKLMRKGFESSGAGWFRRSKPQPIPPA